MDRLGQCEMVLRDGRVIVLSGLTIDDAIEAVRAAGVTSSAQIVVTVHGSAAALLRRVQEARSA